MDIEEITISNLNFEKINENWEVLKKLRIKKDNKKRNDYKYVLKCRKCGEIKEVYTSTVYKSNIKCLKCDALSHIGEVYGTQEIIDFVGWEKDKHGNLNQRFYKVKCTNCGHIYDSKRYDNIKLGRKCIYCSMINDSPGLTMYYRTYKDGAKSRNLDFSLSKEDFTKLVEQNCVYCGNPPVTKEYITTHKTYYTVNGIDRIDSSKGYSIDNCVPCCTMCNTMKLNYSKSEFLNHIKRIHNFNFLNSSSETIENTSSNGSELSTLQANGNGNKESPKLESDIVQSAL